MLGSTRGVKEPSEERTRMKHFIRTSRGKGRPPLEKVLSFRSRLPTLQPYLSQRHVWELIFGSKERRCGETSVMALSFRRNKNGKWRKMMPRPRLLATPLPPCLSLARSLSFMRLVYDGDDDNIFARKWPPSFPPSFLPSSRPLPLQSGWLLSLLPLFIHVRARRSCGPVEAQEAGLV